MPIKKRKTIPKEKAKRGEPTAFFEAALLIETDECILWPYSKQEFGYGRYNIRGTQIAAHREVLLRTTPQPKDKPLALHGPLKCHNPACINKRHLRWGDYLDNKNDSRIDGTIARGRLHGKIKLTEQDIIDIYVSDCSLMGLSGKYGITPQYAGQIRNGKRHARITNLLNRS